MDGENKENIPPQQGFPYPHLRTSAPALGLGPAIFAPEFIAPARIEPAPAFSPTMSFLTSTITDSYAPASSEQAATTSPTAHPTTPPNSVVPANTTPSSTQTPSSQSTPRVKVYSQRVYPKGSTHKHAPIGPRGTVILLVDNPHLEISPFKKGNPEPEKLKLKLKDTKGNIHKRFFPEKDELKWEDSKWISEANKWRNQVLRRMLKHDPKFKGRGVRPKWGMRETTALKTELKNKIEAVGNRRLTGGEWKALTDEHNRRFANEKVNAGERLLGGQKAKTTQDIGDRTDVAIKALFDRNNDLKAFYNDLVGEIATSEDITDVGGVAGVPGDVNMIGEELAFGSDDGMDLDDETDDETPTKKKGNGARRGGNIDPNLENPSDDEDEGQRPAGTQNAARLISCA